MKAPVPEMALIISTGMTPDAARRTTPENVRDTLDAICKLGGRVEIPVELEGGKE